jgi:hypothetical protein
MYGLVKVQTNLNDDELNIVAFFASQTVRHYRVNQRNTRAAVPGNTELFGVTAMPSVIYADPDMVHSFASNVTNNLRVEHDCSSGENTLILQVR